MMLQVSEPVFNAIWRTINPGAGKDTGQWVKAQHVAGERQTKYIIKKSNRKKKDETDPRAYIPKNYVAYFYEYSFVKLLLIKKIMKKKGKFDIVEAIPLIFFVWWFFLSMGFLFFVIGL